MSLAGHQLSKWTIERYISFRRHAGSDDRVATADCTTGAFHIGSLPGQEDSGIRVMTRSYKKHIYGITGEDVISHTTIHASRIEFSVDIPRCFLYVKLPYDPRPRVFHPLPRVIQQNTRWQLVCSSE